MKVSAIFCAKRLIEARLIQNVFIRKLRALNWSFTLIRDKINIANNFTYFTSPSFLADTL